MRFDLLAKRYLFVEHSQWSPTYANKYVMSYINPVKEPQNWTIPLKFFCLSQLTNSLTAVTACNYVI